MKKKNQLKTVLRPTRDWVRTSNFTLPKIAKNYFGKKVSKYVNNVT